jgi:hypothetical protein
MMALINKAQPNQPSIKPVINPPRKAKVITSITSYDRVPFPGLRLPENYVMNINNLIKILQ